MRSPHGKKLKCLFGWAMCSPYMAIIGVGVSRELYSLKYHASIGVLGALQMTIGVLCIFFDVAIGYLQDKEKLLFGPGCFTKARWGRRAPWFIVHSPIMALFMYLSWAPPSMAPSFLGFWYFVCTFVCTWCWENIFIGAKAGIVECYPCPHPPFHPWRRHRHYPPTHHPRALGPDLRRRLPQTRRSGWWWRASTSSSRRSGS